MTWPLYWGDDPGLTWLLLVPVGLVALAVLALYLMKAIRERRGKDDEGERPHGPGADDGSEADP